MRHGHQPRGIATKNSAPPNLGSGASKPAAPDNGMIAVNAVEWENLKDLIKTAPELNMSNFGYDDVHNLNNSMNDIFQALKAQEQ